MHILYLTHDITDPATTKRVRMLLDGGATVIIAGFAREVPPASIEGCHVTDLGTTHSGNLPQRALSVLSIIFQFKKYRPMLVGVDLILARNMEMLAIARKAQRMHRAPIVYEVLDIPRVLAGRGIISTYLVWLETWLRRRVSLIITSSPAFMREYLEKSTRHQYPLVLVENKAFGASMPATAMRHAGPPWRIGWFGAIRCRRSLELLCAVARDNPGLVEIDIRGKFSYHEIPNFGDIVAETTNVSWHGRFQNPEDLAAIYGAVHFNWTIDLSEEGLNSAWNLPNRLYEGSLHGAVPISIEGVETSHLITQLNIGFTLAELKADALVSFLKFLTPDIYENMAHAVANVPTSTWLASKGDCIQLVKQLGDFVERTGTETAPERRRISVATPALVVVPCFNEHTTIVKLVKYLVAEAPARPMTIVIVDGGSTDGSIEIIQQLQQKHPTIVRYLRNRKRTPSTAVNLAVQTYGQGHGYLIRMDTNMHYPDGYCATLITEANRVAADSVVVSMQTVGTSSPLQRSIAAAQGSRMAQRTSGEGRWVEHGHHALIRIDAFRSLGGYDERFTYSEGVEFDLRLIRAGRHIWLTGATSIDYTPRADTISLFRQYHNHGQGRARTMKKHGIAPKLFQLLPISIVPILLLLLTTAWLGEIVVIPALLWAWMCLISGALLAVKSKDYRLATAGPATMIMHSAWSLGFWQGLFTYGKLRT